MLCQCSSKNQLLMILLPCWKRVTLVIDYFQFFFENWNVKCITWGSLGARNMFDHICWQVEASEVWRGSLAMGSGVCFPCLFALSEMRKWGISENLFLLVPGCWGRATLPLFLPFFWHSSPSLSCLGAKRGWKREGLSDVRGMKIYVGLGSN